jgi:hypothetical protein
MTWLWVLLIVLGVLAVGIATGPVMAAMKRERAERGTRNAPAHEPSEYVGEGGASVAILAASSGAVSGQKDGEILVSPLSAPGAAAHTTLADPGQPRPVPQVEDAPAQRLLDSAAEREALAHAREAVASEREAAASTLDAADRQSAALAGAQLRDAAAEARDEAAEAHERAAAATLAGGDTGAVAADLQNRADGNRERARGNATRREADHELEEGR